MLLLLWMCNSKTNWLTDLVSANEITKVMGIVNVGKTLARCFGQLLSGYVVQSGLLRYAFIISGSVLLSADFILILSFIGIDKKVLVTFKKEVSSFLF